MRQEQAEGKRTGRQEQTLRGFVPRTCFNRFKNGHEFNERSYNLSGTTSEANRELIFKISEMTREQKLDEIRTLALVIIAIGESNKHTISICS